MRNKDFLSDEQVIKLHNRARRLVAGDGQFDLDLDRFTSLASCQLWSLVEVYRRRARALVLCAKANSRAADLRREWERRETKRIEGLIRGIPQDEQSFLHGEDDGGQLEYIFNRLVDYACLVGMDDEILLTAFSRKEIYFEIYENQNSRTVDGWRALVERHAAAGE